MMKQVIAGALAVIAGCAAPTPAPDARPAESARPSSAAAAPPASATAAASALASSGAAPAPQPEDASAPAPPLDGGARAADEAAATDGAPPPGAPPAASADATAIATNKILPPLESEELTARARALFDAIVKNEPALADPFWFPKEPFIPLKDVKDPGKYWDNLHAAYANDVKAMHRKRKSWEGARFVGFEVGSRPKWVPPGDEVNKIGYYRSFHGKLKVELDGKPASVDVHTIISWQGRWYITHLGDFKKR
ncbi:hypothetical protein WMF20_33625 [Sorangium sp. So ce834]|uniref:hypothetical protein n=1 Tax=Sorangium sp. So ce834 TaxID=3133321 RepID=UPI003F642ED7